MSPSSSTADTANIGDAPTETLVDCSGSVETIRGARFLTMTVRVVCAVPPSLSVIVKVTVKVPFPRYSCETRIPVARALSPKDQLQETIVPSGSPEADPSNRKVVAIVPSVGDTVAAAVGRPFAVTLTATCAELVLPSSSVTTTSATYVP